MHLFKWMSSYYWFFLSFFSFSFFFFHSYVTSVMQPRSLALAHLHTYWLQKELGCALPPVAVAKPRHGFTRETPWSLSSSCRHACSSAREHLPVAQCTKRSPWGVPSSYPHSLSFAPSPAHILLGWNSRRGNKKQGQYWEHQPPCMRELLAHTLQGLKTPLLSSSLPCCLAQGCDFQPIISLISSTACTEQRFQF